MSATNLTFGEVRGQLAQRFPSATLSQLTSFLNERYRRVARSLRWVDLSLQAVLQTIAPYETGTLAATSGSASITGTGTTWTSAMSGRGIRIGSDNAYYQFTYASATTATLDRTYEGDTATAAEYKIWQSIYPLAADVRTLKSMRVTSCPYDLDPVSQEELDERDAARLTYGTPSCYALHMPDLSTPARRQVELWPIPDDAFGVPFWYVQDPTLFAVGDTATYLPTYLSPTVLYQGVEADVKRIVEKDLAAAREAEGLYRESLSEMRSEEADRRPQTRMKLAERYTEHRRRRWTR